MQLRNCLLASFIGTLVGVAVGTAAPAPSVAVKSGLNFDRVAPVLFEIKPHAVYASTDLARWEVFTPQGVRLANGISIEFAGADRGRRLEGVDPTGGALSIYAGSRHAAWREHLAGYRGSAYRGLYPGVDLIYHRERGKLKGDYVLEAGADWRRIRFYVRNAKRVGVRPDRVEIETREGEQYVENIPLTYQIDRAGLAQFRRARYRQDADGAIGFEVDRVDPTLGLVIDPTLAFSTYIGGSRLDQVTAVAYAADGSLLAAGWTESPDLLGATNAFAGSTDVFLARFVVSAQGVVSLTSLGLYGGSGLDKATAIAVNANGSVVVAGITQSVNFPVLAPAGVAAPFSNRLKGYSDGFILKFSGNGSQLVYATYFGGSGAEQINGVAVDASETVYVAGSTSSSSDFPLVGAVQTAYGGGNSDGFVSALRPDQTLAYSTYLGGAGDDVVNALAMLNGEVYVTGGTYSTNFPVVNAVQAVSGGGQDAFASKFSIYGVLVYSTYLGGSGGAPGFPEMGSGIAVNSNGEAFIAGVTSSTDFPLASAAQTLFGGGASDAFLVKLSASGLRAFSTLLGGSSLDQANAVAVLPGGSVVVTGMTSSSDFPALSPVQGALTGLYNVFLSAYSNTGVLQWSTLWGGSGADSGGALSTNAAGEILLGGTAGSQDLPLANPVQSSVSLYHYHGFLARFATAVGTRVLPNQAGIFRAGTWFLDTMHSWVATKWFAFGLPGDVPITGDWDNTGKVRLGLFRNGQWLLDINGDNTWTSPPDTTVVFGQAGDVPLFGDWDNTGRMRMGLFRKGVWLFDMNGDGVWTSPQDKKITFGMATDIPLWGDWDNTGKMRMGVFRNGQWWLDMNGDGVWKAGIDKLVVFGQAGDIPLYGDWDNTGRMRMGVFRNGQWLLDMNGDGQLTSGTDKSVGFGLAGDTPLVSVWQ